MKKAALHNLGCKVNAYETEAMQEMLEKAGYEIVPFKEGADLYVINTCTVTNIADRKSRQMLHRARKMNPDAVVVAAGCYVQAKEKEIQVDDCIDIVLGNNKKQNLIEALEEYESCLLYTSYNLLQSQPGAVLWLRVLTLHPEDQLFLSVHNLRRSVLRYNHILTF